MVQQSTTTDLAFLFSLGVSCVYLHIESDIYDRCSRPIHWWQTASYACLVAFRLAHILGTRTAVTADLSGPSSEAVDFLLSLRHKNALPKVMMGFTWLVALPFFYVLERAGRGVDPPGPARDRLHAIKLTLVVCDYLAMPVLSLDCDAQRIADGSLRH